jgi:hypothetical protein
VYGTPEEVPIREDTPLQAVSPYGRTKLFQEEMFRWVLSPDLRSFYIIKPGSCLCPKNPTDWAVCYQLISDFTRLDLTNESDAQANAQQQRAKRRRRPGTSAPPTQSSASCCCATSTPWGRTPAASWASIRPGGWLS